MRKHEIQCRIEKDEVHALDGIQNKINKTYVISAANIMKKSNLSKEKQICIINQIQKNFIN